MEISTYPSFLTCIGFRMLAVVQLFNFENWVDLLSLTLNRNWYWTISSKWWLHIFFNLYHFQSWASKCWKLENIRHFSHIFSSSFHCIEREIWIWMNQLFIIIILNVRKAFREFSNFVNKIFLSACLIALRRNNNWVFNISKNHLNLTHSSITSYHIIDAKTQLWFFVLLELILICICNWVS